MKVLLVKQEAVDDLSACLLNLLPQVSILPGLLTVSLIIVAIKNVQIFKGRYVGK